ncbi:MAG TPA: RNB domain-containing ribonuclease [Polyangiaceae bacterium]
MSERGKPFDLRAAARQAMRDAGFLPDLPEQAVEEAERLAPARPGGPDVRDLRALPWSSIDNDDSRDLDQIEVAERLPGGHVRVRVGIADVDALVHRGSALDAHAERNTCTVYTAAAIFPMLPETLSTDRTSLGEGVERLAVVVEMDVDPTGAIATADVYPALVKNHAKLAYDGVGAWLEESGSAPARVAASAVLQEQLRLQDAAAQALRKRRYERGALDLETIEARAVMKEGAVVGLEVTRKSRARALIEDFMIAANGSMARFLDGRGVSSIRRVVKAPERWQRIVALAVQCGDTLPAEPSSRALAAFLERRKVTAPDTFADISLAVVKLMGPGEYALERPGEPHDGHFGLAVTDYTHSTAPNRRFADLVTQRLLKAALARKSAPYPDLALAAIAAHCTQKENDARKVERTTRKQAAAVLLGGRIGQEFDAIVTGAADKGTFARLIQPPAEGRIIAGQAGLDVGDRVRVRLVATDPRRGFIDFVRA